MVGSHPGARTLWCPEYGDSELWLMTGFGVPALWLLLLRGMRPRSAAGFGLLVAGVAYGLRAHSIAASLVAPTGASADWPWLCGLEAGIGFAALAAAYTWLGASRPDGFQPTPFWNGLSVWMWALGWCLFEGSAERLGLPRAAVPLWLGVTGDGALLELVAWIGASGLGLVVAAIGGFLGQRRLHRALILAAIVHGAGLSARTYYEAQPRAASELLGVLALDSAELEAGQAESAYLEASGWLVASSDPLALVWLLPALGASCDRGQSAAVLEQGEAARAQGRRFAATSGIALLQLEPCLEAPSSSRSRIGPRSVLGSWEVRSSTLWPAPTSCSSLASASGHAPGTSVVSGWVCYELVSRGSIAVNAFAVRARLMFAGPALPGAFSAAGAEVQVALALAAVRAARSGVPEFWHVDGGRGFWIDAGGWRLPPGGAPAPAAVFPIPGRRPVAAGSSLGMAAGEVDWVFWAGLAAWVIMGGMRGVRTAGAGRRPRADGSAARDPGADWRSSEAPLTSPTSERD